MSLVLGSIRRARRFVCAPGALALALLTSRAVHADPLPVELAWDAPAECPSQSEVMSELSRITRVKPGRVVTAIRAQAQIARTSDGHYKLSLRTEREDQTGDTELEATSCSVLKRGVTL
ncbi:MAG TPA: hypothetical protein VHV51_12780, partial [Polyangiaceae bacterium]|nr:hypothetical protein [Polyangiaceae bacterium]